MTFSSGFEVVGVRSVIQGLDTYLAGSRRINQANAAMAASSLELERVYGKAVAGQLIAAGKLEKQQVSLANATQAQSARMIKSIALFGAVGIAALGVGVAKAAINFESAFAGVRKTVEATEPELRKLAVGIRELAREIPATTTEIAGVAEAAGQLGVATPAILGFTRTMIDLGETTMGIGVPRWWYTVWLPGLALLVGIRAVAGGVRRAHALDAQAGDVSGDAS